MSNNLDVNEFDLGDGSTVAIEVSEPTGRGYQTISRASEQERQSFQTALDRIKPAAERLLATISDLASRPDEVEVEFGIKFTGKMGAIIASTSTEGNFNIRLTWRAPGEEQAPQRGGMTR